MHGDSRDYSPLANQAYAGAGAEGVDGLSPEHKDGLDPGISPDVGSGRDTRPPARGKRSSAGRPTEGIFIGLALCAVTSTAWRKRQSRISAPMLANAALYEVVSLPPFQSERGPAVGLGDGVWRAGGAAQSTCSRPIFIACPTLWPFAPSSNPGTRCSSPRRGMRWIPK